MGQNGKGGGWGWGKCREKDDEREWGYCLDYDY